MFKYTKKDPEKDSPKRFYLTCSMCGEEVERAHSFKKVTCFNCKKERKLVYNQIKKLEKYGIITPESD